MKMNYAISRRGFIRFSLVSCTVALKIGTGLAVMPLKSLFGRPSLNASPGTKLEDLISQNNMKWVYVPNANYSNKVLDTSDEAIIGVDPDINNVTVRNVTDPRTAWSYAGLNLVMDLNDSPSSAIPWEVLAYSDNLTPLNPVWGGNIIGTNNIAPPEMGGEIYDFLYRGLDTAGGSSGTTRNLNEQIDRYQTLVTIDYVADGTPAQFQFYAPHNVVKHLMSWDPIQFHEFGYTINSQSNEFVPFFQALQELIQSPQQQNGLEEDLSRLINRMTPSPNPGPNPAYTDLALLDGISQGDVTVQDNLYPVGVELEMADLTTNAGKVSAMRQNSDYQKYVALSGGSRLSKSSGILDISYTPPMPDATLPTSMQGLNNQNHLGWMHSYLVQCDANQKPELTFSGMSSNLQPSWMSEATGNPNEYMVHVLLQTGDQQSLDNLAINLVQIPVGIKDGRDNPLLPTTPLVVYSNFPEPFNPRTTVKYDMKNPGQLDISIYNILGQKIENLYHGQHQAGKDFEMHWDSKGRSTGVYFMRFETPGYVKSERMILIK